MALRRLSAVCRACPLADRCKNKRMEEVGALPWPPLLNSAVQPLADEVAAPVMAEHDYREIHVGNGMTMTIDLKDVMKQIEEQLSLHTLRSGFLGSAT